MAARGAGRSEEIRRHYERALTLSQGRRASAHVAYAEAVAIPNQDRTEFMALMHKALAVDLEADPEHRLHEHYRPAPCTVVAGAHRRTLFLSGACGCRSESPTIMRKTSTRIVSVLLTCVLFLQLPATGMAQVVIKLGTVAPEGSAWHDALLRIRQQWRDISHGEVELRIYAGGVLGGETEMVRKVQRQGLDAIAISGSGLPFIDSSVDCLNIPMLFASYEELDYVRNGIAAELEQRLAHKHFKVLSWAEGGWIYFFTKVPVRTPDDLRKLRLWTAAGYPEAEKLSKRWVFRWSHCPKPICSPGSRPV